MDVTQLPFNQFLGIRACEDKENGILELAAAPKYLNHVGTMHATAIYGLAEASSGQFLANRIQISEETVLPILRRADIKYRRPAAGYIYSKGNYIEEDWLRFRDSLRKRKRALLSFQIDVLDSDNTLVASANFEWFVTVRSDG